ncbi:hypothetical protein HBB16_12225 [Pseudonocardia sp. MCCB 268]|nr:hypothetical protein [Pseudonocardia cytotoxica]
MLLLELAGPGDDDLLATAYFRRRRRGEARARAAGRGARQWLGRAASGRAPGPGQRGWRPPPRPADADCCLPLVPSPGAAPSHRFTADGPTAGPRSSPAR